MAAAGHRFHMLTLGHLVGELVRRVTGMALKEFVRQEITEPLDADFQIGARREDNHRTGASPPPMS
jgi:CubicO group peptidase (beta-lactamase class C family)